MIRNPLLEMPVETLEIVAAVAVLAALIAAMVRLRKAWRDCRENADGKLSGQFLWEVAHHSVQTIAVTFLVVFTGALIGLSVPYWPPLPDFHAIAPALI
jgi:ABC-type transport system involved in cytochrome c biogenesis permease component